MNHSDTSNPEDTSKELEVLKEASEEPKEEEQKEVIEPEEAPAEEPEEWICDICETVYSNDNSYSISGYHEKICGQCYDRGLMWCIREAWKWRAQIRIDVIRKPKDE